MNIIDIAIILFILLGAFIGWKQGFTKSLVNCVGLIIIIVLAFLLKNPISEFFMTYLPFFDFFGDIKGVTVLNIALYEVLAFLVLFVVFYALLKFLMIGTSIFEKILKYTVILGIPSKILGMILGTIKNYVIVFMILYVLTLPTITDNEFLTKSNYIKPILEKTPVLSIFADKTVDVATEFAEIKSMYNKDTTNEFNLDTLDLFLKYDIVKPKTVHILINKEKIKIDGVDAVLEKYEEE